MRLLILLLAILSAPVSAQVYKWTDENGVTHFGSQPPPGHHKPVDVKPASGGSAAPAAESDIIRRARELERRENAAANGKTDTMSPEMRYREAANKRACELAHIELESAERELTLFQSMKAYDFVLDPRQKKVDHWKERVRIHCGDS